MRLFLNSVPRYGPPLNRSFLEVCRFSCQAMLSWIPLSDSGRSKRLGLRGRSAERPPQKRTLLETVRSSLGVPGPLAPPLQRMKERVQDGQVGPPSGGKSAIIDRHPITLHGFGLSRSGTGVM